MACFGPLPWSQRRIFVHIKGLPAGSAFAVMRNDGQAAWSQEAELLASIHDRMAAVQYYTGAAAGVQADPPSPFPRPAQPTPEPAPVSPQQLMDFLGRGNNG